MTPSCGNIDSDNLPYTTLQMSRMGDALLLTVIVIHRVWVSGRFRRRTLLMADRSGDDGQKRGGSTNSFQFVESAVNLHEIRLQQVLHSVESLCVRFLW